MVTFIQLSGDTAQSDGTNHMTPIIGGASSLGPCCDAGAPDIIRLLLIAHCRKLRSRGTPLSATMTHAALTERELRHVPLIIRPRAAAHCRTAAGRACEAYLLVLMKKPRQKAQARGQVITDWAR
jgi:hypothetical protein